MTDTLPAFPAILEHWSLSGGPAPVVLICEHASNALPLAVPALGGDLGLSEETRQSHAAWDIGALGLSRSCFSDNSLLVSSQNATSIADRIAYSQG